LIATWNLRHFGELTEKWKAAEKDSPKRDLHELLCIIEVIRRFDIIAVQEVKGNIKCLRDTMKMRWRNNLHVLPMPLVLRPTTKPLYC